MVAIVENHRASLRKCGGVKPTNPKSAPCSVSLKDVERYRDNLAEIERPVRQLPGGASYPKVKS